jgi:hypothetical protein
MSEIIGISDQNYKLSAEQYDLLYKRFLKRQPIELLDCFNIDPYKKCILDVCCGANMRATRQFIGCGALSVHAVDNYSFPIISPISDDLADKEAFIYQNGIYKFCKTYRSLNRRFDIIFCQQGINYIFSKDLIENFAFLLSKNGKIVFNTFVNKPKKEPTTKTYHIDGNFYVENYWLDEDIVHHIQFCSKVGSHYTKFRYVSHDEIINVCKELDLILNHVDKGATRIYKIEKV